MELLKMMARLPRPTPEQCTGFVRHVCSAHSWYKHLPLSEGGQFVLLLSEDAGNHYPLVHPHLGTSPNSTELYRASFGYLTYHWRIDPAGPFDRDGGGTEPAPDLPEWYLDRFGIKLYPYVSPDGATLEVLCGSTHQGEMIRIQGGCEHPGRDSLVRIKAACEAKSVLWQQMTPREQSFESERVHDESIPRDMPLVAQYQTLDQLCFEILAHLQRQEEAKVHDALTRVLAALG